jgi:hypothetical protein
MSVETDWNAVGVAVKRHFAGVFAMKTILALGVAASLAAVSAPAMAATSLVNPPCTLGVGTSCLFNGNLNLQLTGNNSLGDADAAYNSQTPTPAPLLNLAGFANKADVTSGFGSDQISGSVTAPFLVSFYAVKAGDFFDLFEIAPSTTFNWSTTGISVGNGQTPGISHLLYFGAAAAVPEPAAWAIMITGFAGIGMALRWRQAASRVA